MVRTVAELFVGCHRGGQLVEGTEGRTECEVSSANFQHPVGIYHMDCASRSTWWSSPNRRTNTRSSWTTITVGVLTRASAARSASVHLGRGAAEHSVRPR